MKKLQQHTKAELISKLNGLKSNNNPTFFSNFMTFLLAFKSFILKITLIALIIKIFKKYSIIRKLFTIINTILFSIFGISMIDIYEIESLSKIFHKLIDLFSNFHSNLLELFGKRGDIPVKSPSIPMRGIQPETTGIQTGNDPSNRIIERFKQLINKDQDEIIQDENTPYYKNKYVILAGLLVLSGLTWYFYDDIKPVGSSILAWINLFRSRPDPSSDDSSGNIQANYKFDISKIKDSIKNKIYGKKGDDDYRSNSPDSFIELLNKKGKAPDFGNFTQSELERRGLLNPQLTGLPKITGENTQFITESNAVLREIKAFDDRYVNNLFPTEKLQQGIYNVLRDRLHRLSDSNPIYYQDLIKNDKLNDRIDNFIELEKDIFPDLVDSPKSKSYNDVELDQAKVTDVWSDKALSPQQPLSPQFIQETVMESIEKDKPKSPLDTFWDRLKNINNKEEKSINLTIVDLIPEEDELIGQELLPEARPLISEVLNKPTPANSDGSESSKSAMDHYFKKDEPEKPAGFASLFDQINAKRNNKDVVGSTPEIEITNITEEVIPIENIEAVLDTKTPEDNPVINNLLAQINSRRLEYGTPNIANVGLPRPELSPLNLPTSSNLPDDNNEIDESEDSSEAAKVNSPQEDIPSFKNIGFKINRGLTKDRFIDIDFGANFKDVSKVLIITNDGKTQYLDPHLISKNPNQALKWDNFGSSNPDNKQLDIFKLFIIDKSAKSHEIYSNSNVKILDSYWTNKGRFDKGK
jgi:hypothetical protein